MVTDDPPTSFSTVHAAETVGLTYRQLWYWARTNLVVPSVAPARGSGTRQLYSSNDLIVLQFIKRLLDHGARLESVRSIMPRLLAMGPRAAEVSLTIDHLGFIDIDL